MQKLSPPVKLIKESIKIFFEKKNLIYFASIYLLLVPFQIFTYFQEPLINPTTGSFENTPFAWVIVLVNVLYSAVYLLTSIAGIVAVKRIVDGGTLNFKETFSFAWKNLWGFLLLSSLIFLAVFGGMVLLIVPGIVFAVWFSFAKFVFIDQGLPIKASMAKSHEMVKGKFWAILGRFFVFGLFAGFIGAVVSSIPYGIGSSITTLLGALFILPSYFLYIELKA